MRELPSNVQPYKKTPEFVEDTIPAALLGRHNTKEGVWGKLVVLEGALQYFIEDDAPILLTPETFGVVEPTIWHRVAPEGKVRFYVEFHR